MNDIEKAIQGSLDMRTLLSHKAYEIYCNTSPLRFIKIADNHYEMQGCLGNDENMKLSDIEELLLSLADEEEEE